MEEKLSIKVKIDEHSIPIRVKREQEERLRKAAQLVNERLSIYKKTFKIDDSDRDYICLAMAAIDLVSKYVDTETRTDDTELLSELRILSSDIENYIQKIQAL